MECQRNNRKLNIEPHHESRIFAEIAFGEYEQKLSAVRVLIGSLQGMGHAGWEIPQIPGTLSAMSVRNSGHIKAVLQEWQGSSDRRGSRK